MSPRATPMKPDERRRAIVEAVVPLLVRAGGEVTTKQVAQAAGIAEGTIFRAFPDKPALWRAAVEHVMDPATELAELHGAVDGAADLRSLIVAAAEHLADRSDRVMSVMGVWRASLLAQYRAGTDADGVPGAGPDGRHRHRPPQFFVEANRALVAGLSDLFEAHADELRVPPTTAAAVLRTLVIGQRHPGAIEELALSAEEVADVMLDGVARRVPVEVQA